MPKSKSTLEYQLWIVHAETCDWCAKGGDVRFCAIRDNFNKYKGERELVAAFTYLQDALNQVNDYNDRGLRVFMEHPATSGSQVRMYISRKEVETL